MICMKHLLKVIGIYTDIISHLFGFFNTFLAFYGIYRHFLFKKRVALIFFANKACPKDAAKGVKFHSDIYFVVDFFFLKCYNYNEIL